ncbi:hypothetical protein CLV33_1212 [Jejuia pallidilutea]|uniref:Uncharacterized protein n=1 Tax=Jejuia pallidilutea TaxID=504487 RepID=A0A362WXE6_9FLAO|nr:hypothetical protein [Jejuia pallidilutea]PQV44582.1 hypothetical protein CLV33_1212 [Jejuia pallidilutea]
MDEFKLENFKKEYKKDLIFLELSDFETKRIVNRIKNENRFNNHLPLTLSLFWKELESNSINVESTNILEEIFNVLNLKVSSSSIVYIIWDFEKPIDVFKYDEVSKYWDDIWYDTTDEIILLCIEDYYILITDYGEIRYSISQPALQNL